MKGTSIITKISLMLASCISFCCAQQSAKNLPLQGTRIAYIEASRGDQITYGNFGDVYIADLASHETYRLTDDDCYDVNPMFNRNGSMLYFISNRTGSNLARKIRGIGGPYKLYEVDLIPLASGAATFEQVARVIKDTIWDEACFLRSEKSILFLSSDTSIDKLNVRTGLISAFAKIPGMAKAYQIRDFSADPDGQKIALDLAGKKDPLSRLAIYDCKHNTLSIDTVTRQIIFLGDWSSDGRSFLFRQESSIYECRGINEITALLTESDSLFLLLNKTCYVDSNRIAFIGSKKKRDPEQHDLSSFTEIMVYDRKTHQSEYVTRTGRLKSYLSIVH